MGLLHVIFVALYLRVRGCFENKWSTIFNQVVLLWSTVECLSTWYVNWYLFHIWKGLAIFFFSCEPTLQNMVIVVSIMSAAVHKMWLSIAKIVMGVGNPLHCLYVCVFSFSIYLDLMTCIVILSENGFIFIMCLFIWKYSSQVDALDALFWLRSSWLCYEDY